MQAASVYLVYLVLPPLALMSVDECQYVSVSIFYAVLFVSSHKAAGKNVPH